MSINIDLEKITDMGLIAQLSYQTYGDSPLVINETISTFTEDGNNYNFNFSYTVVDYTSTSTDMQAVLFEKNDNSGNPTGEYVIAFRGTQGVFDIGIDAIIGLENLNPQFEDAKDFVLEMMALNNISVDNVTLTGHSLGGILTQSVGAVLGISGYAFNPYGTERLLTMWESYSNTLPEALINVGVFQVLKAFGLESSYADFARENILNVSYNDFGNLTGDPLSVLATDLTSNHLGSYLPIVGEDLGVSGHSMPVLNAALNHYNEILNHFVEDTTYADLSAVYAYGALGDTDGYIRVEEMFDELDIVNAEQQTLSFDLNIIVENFPANFVALAKNNHEFLYALTNLNPYTIAGVDYSFLDGEVFSEQYLEDRSSFLFQLIHPETPSVTGDDTNFYDEKLGVNVFAGNSTFDISDRYYSFGIAGSDNFQGEGKEDHFYGMDGHDVFNAKGGDDYLEGGKGHDVMYGGSGNDTFYIQGTDEAYDEFYGDGDAGDIIQGSAYDDTIRVNFFSYVKNSIEKIDGGAGENILAGTTDNNIIDLTGITVSNINRIEGGDGQDIIIGSSGEDTIYGGSKEKIEDYSQDRLEGGAGNDTYYIGANDIINDIDSKGTIIFNGQQVTNLTFSQQAENSSYYKNSDNGWSAFLEDDGSLNVIIGDLSGSFIIENFTTDNYGISLETYEASSIAYDFPLTGTEFSDEMAIAALGQDQSDWLLDFTSFPVGITDNTPLYSVNLPTEAPNLTISGGESGDFLFGFQASDTIEGGGGSDIIMGYLGYWNDVELTMTGTLEGDFIDGGSGNDWIGGSGGDDQIFGGTDDDTIQSFDGEDYLSGDTGNDVLAGGAHNAILMGGEGDDALFGDGYFTGTVSVTLGQIDSIGISYTYGDAGYATGYSSINYAIHNDAPNGGNDFLSGASGRDWLDGGVGQDVLFGGDDADSLFGGDGDDELSGGFGNDWLVGDNSDLSGTGNDILLGGYGDDLLYGLGGEDKLYGDAGNDILHGFTGDDLLSGGSENDQLWGEEGNDILRGGNGDDELFGGTHNDTLSGDDGRDTLFGQDGNDILDGGRGIDSLAGGTGDDRYTFKLGDGYDIVEDSSGINSMLFGSGISETNLFVSKATYDDSTGHMSFTQLGSDLWIEYSSSDGVLLRNGAGELAFNYQFEGGTFLSHSQIQEMSSNSLNVFPGEEPPPEYVPDSPQSNDPSVPLPSMSSTSWPGISTKPLDGIGTVSSVPLFSMSGMEGMDISMADGYESNNFYPQTSFVGDSILSSNGYNDIGHDGRLLLKFFREQATLNSNHVKFSLNGNGGYFTQSMMLVGIINGTASYGLNTSEPASIVSDAFTSAQRVVPRRDPLTLDLDGDGIETLALDPDNPILFDHTGDGVKTGTGWIQPDDGFLVLDRNGNGTIDNGRELFGDSTPVFDNEGNEIGLAKDGFDALSQEDSNGDGIVNLEDSRWLDLRVWQDLNSDGISQEGELKTLDELNITGINIAKTEHSRILPGGNEIADVGTYVRVDGSIGTTGTTGALADVNFATDTFHRVFDDSIPLTEETQVLPDMKGSGTVRDLREAATLSPELSNLLNEYASVSTRSGQLEMLDNLIIAWGETSDQTNMEEQAEVNGYNFSTNFDESQQARLVALEKFNGRNFYRLPWEEENGVSGSVGMNVGEDDDGQPTISVTMNADHSNLLNQSWESLRQSVYNNLLLQTRLKPYMEGIGFIEGEHGVEIDFSSTITAFQSRFNEAPEEAVSDLLDMQRMVGRDLSGLGWNGYDQLQTWLTTAVADSAMTSVIVLALSDFGYPGLAVDGEGSNAGEVIVGDGLLNGRGGDDMLLGGEGNDTLHGGTGNDLLHGGYGNDTYVYGVGDGVDTIVESHGNIGNDTLQFGEGILAGDLDIYASGNKLVFNHITTAGGLIIENWFGSLADNVHRLDTLNFSDGKSLDLNRLHLGNSSENSFTGNESNDLLVGGAGDDTLTGEAGDDLLIGGVGSDTMAGGTGNDTYSVDNAGDTVVEAVDEGLDSVESRIDYTLTDNVENLTLAGTGSTGGTGNELDNTIIGNSSHNSLYGMAGNDTLNGGAGNDILDGGTGADIMAGNSGDDTYVVESTDDQVTENVDEGTDIVQSGINYILNANVENLNLTGSESLSGIGNELDNVLMGNSANNILIGLSGDDTLEGGVGADTMRGGTGDDTYVVESSGDSVIENIDEGTDTSKSSITYTLTDNVENLTLTGITAIDGTGNELDNVVTGNNTANTLTGLAGNDILDGAGGADSMLGGIGDDTYVVEDINDNVIESTDEGTDIVESSIDYLLADNVENLILTGSSNINGTGNALNNILLGNNRNNVLDGGLGEDSMAGHGGNDTYILNNTADTVNESLNQGLDTVISPFDYTLTDNVENLILTGTALNGTGNKLDNSITGTDADNTLTGLVGNDTLDGGAGGDLLVGGLGNDTFVVDNFADITLENLNEGIDTVRADLTWTLADNVEILELTGFQNLDGTGNALDNEITGNTAANTLSGLAGNDLLDGGEGSDSMLGGTGDDTYVVDNIGDLVIDDFDAGTDSVESSITYTLTDNVENLELTGKAAIDGIGNELTNNITGNNADNNLSGLAGNDQLDGGSGADTMIGGIGDDSYVVDNEGDHIVELAGEGVDTVQSSISHSLAGNVENLTLTGLANISAVGNNLNNTLTGNKGNNLIDGGTGADSMNGGEGNDTYVVDNVADRIVENVNEGTDDVGSSIDYTLTANVEHLQLTGVNDLTGIGNTLDNTLTGNTGSNILSGLAGTDILIGNEGDDLLDGGLGEDTMSGGIGDDIYVVDNTADVVAELEGEGTDTVRSSIDYVLGENLEDLELTAADSISGTGNTLDNSISGNSGDNSLLGLEGNDELYGGAGNDLLNGGTGSDTMAGGAGNDIYIVDNNSDTTVELADEGIDIVESSLSHTLAANIENLTLTGSSYINGTGNDLDNVIKGNVRNNTLRGMEGNDTLVGGTGHDTLDGGTGADIMLGGIYNDTYIVDNEGDSVTEYGGQGYDYVRASIDYTLTDNVESLTLTGSENLNGTGNNLNNSITSNSGNNILDGQDGHDTLYGDAGEDILIGGTGNDRLYGQDDEDKLFGDAGSDILDGGAGADVMTGGADNDTYYVNDNGDVVVEEMNEGIDIVSSSISYTLTDNVENITLTGDADINGTGNELNNIIRGNNRENVLDGLAGNDTIYGNSGNDTLLGGEGDDYLDGGYGSDFMSGGTGNDIYIVNSTGDTMTEQADEGTDHVRSSVTYTLAENVENLTLTGYGYIDGTGNDLDNVITGNYRSTLLKGLSGNDTLIDYYGNDTLDGGSGADTMSGGTGNDTYVVDDVGDVVNESYNRGTDYVRSNIDYTLTANVENLFLTGEEDLNGTGNNLNNVITGNEGSNILDGKDGNDTLDGGAGLDNMFGGNGNDTYIVDTSNDSVIENSGEGLDLVRASAEYTLSDNVENLTLTGTADINGSGNELNNVVSGNTGANMLVGLAGDDSIYGNSGDDVLLGGGGNDILDGGAGQDSMQGNSGDDIYIVDHAMDAVFESQGEGIDTVQSDIDYILGANVENLLLTGTLALTGSGNEMANEINGNNSSNILYGLEGNDTLAGNDGNDTLDGGTGADSMYGGSGNDTYIVDDAGDLIFEFFNQGIDHVRSEISYSLTDNVEHLTLEGIEDLNGTGNSLNNVLTGNMGTNILDGGVGADIMAGGAGDDIYMVDNANDHVLESAVEGDDSVFAAVSHTLDSNVENLILTGALAINGTGNESDNILKGNSADNALFGQGGNDLLDGGAGTDTMAGGSGDDIYFVDNSGDTIVESAGGGIDTVFAGSNHTLNTDVENITLLGLESFNASGNDLANRINGNGSDNILAGEGGDDILQGGSGTDILLGGAGDDHFIFLAGGSNDRFVDFEGLNTVHVGSGLTVSDLKADIVGNDMLVQVLDSDDTFTLVGWAVNETEGLNRMEFEDGTILNRAGIEMLLNLPPEANPDQITAYEDGGAVRISTSYLLVNDTDPNPWDSISVTRIGSSLLDVSVALVGDEIIYDINGDFQYLAEGEILQDSFGYTVSDTKGATDESIVHVDIVGVNDIPIIAADSANLVEDEVITVQGNVLDNDHDIDITDQLSVADPIESNDDYGRFLLAVGGTYTYTLDNESIAVQSMGRYHEVVQLYDFTVTDGVAEISSSFELSISGVNNAPVIASSLADQQLVFNKPFCWTVPVGSFVEIDEGDVLDYAATLADGSALPDWLVFDAATQTFSGTAPKIIETLDVMVTATDSVAGMGSEGNLSAFDVFHVSTSHGNQGVGNGIDAPSWGHDINFNDAFGTAPGTQDINLEFRIITGTNGDDLLIGSTVNDALLGGDGNDIMSGREGRDIFVFDTSPDSITNRDTIEDFTSGEDLIGLDSSIFSGLGTGGILSPENFLANVSGLSSDENDYLLYNTTTGALLFDADGNGEGAAVEFAILTNKVEINSNDFMIVS